MQTSDRRAIIALCCIAIFCLGMLIVVDALRGQRIYDSTISVADSDTLLNKTEVVPTDDGRKLTMRYFDPNTVDSLTLIGLGCSERQVKSFLHYRAAGKVFRSPNDVSQTYGWTKEDIDRLSPYMVFESQRASGIDRRQEANESERSYHDTDGTRTDQYAVSHKFTTHTMVDINTADSATLCRIPGIGAKKATWIVGYRQRLGGFHKVDQLLDIPIITSDELAWVTVSDTFHVRPLNINTSTFGQLNAHPYVTYEQTKSLLRYIRLYGKISDMETLKATGIFTDDELQRLLPYLAL